MQVTFGQVPDQGMRLGLPRAEQAVDLKESLLAGFLPEFAEDAQTGVAAIADYEMRLIRTAGDRRG